jgi:hypothetical protein
MQMDIYMSWLQQPSTNLHNLVPPMNEAILKFGYKSPLGVGASLLSIPPMCMEQS